MAAAAVPVAIGSLALNSYGIYQARGDAQDAARTRRAAAEFEAQQLEQNAGQAEAGAQRVAFQTGRTGQLVQSRALALAAASGGSASDPTVMNIIAGIGSETAYRKSVDLYNGEARARQLRLAAAADRLSGEIGAGASLAQGRATEIAGASNILAGSASLFSRYGYRNPSPSGGAGFFSNPDATDV